MADYTTLGDLQCATCHDDPCCCRDCAKCATTCHRDDMHRVNDDLWCEDCADGGGWIYPSCPECLEIVLPEQPQGLPVGGRPTHEPCYLRRFDREYLGPLRAMRRAV